jgi:Ca-activated chloride channel family protein
MVGGRYRSLQIDDSDLDYLLKEITLPRDSETLTLDRTADAWEDQGYWLVLLLLPIVLAMFRRGWLLTLMPFLLFIGQPQPAQAQTWDNLWLTPDQQGQRALQAGDTAQAAQLFENRDWAGTAAYRGEDYEAAVEHFSEPSDTDDWYNRGNALARVGNIDDAIAAYKESLAMDPGRTDAEENLALLEQLKDQQQQQQQDNEQQDQDQDQQQDQQDQQDPSAEDQQQPQDQEQQDQQSGDKPQDNQSNPDEQQQDPEAGEQEEQEEEPASPEEQEQSQEQTDEGEQQEVPAQAEPSPEDQERDQAMEQWLRRVPDDPSGLLREKFRYESQQREAEGQRRRDDSDW